VRRYTVEDERRIRLRANLREWAKAELLDGSQAAEIDGRLHTELRRAGILVRASLAFFTIIVVAAAVGLLLVSFRARDEIAFGATLAVAAFVCFGLADFLSGALRVYRNGYEEALAVSAVVLLTTATAIVVDVNPQGSHNLNHIVTLVVACAASFVVYARFGLLYSAMSGMVCAALVPTQFGLTQAAERLCVSAAFVAMFLVMRSRARADADTVFGDDFGWLAAVACAGAYLSLNLRVIDMIGSWLWRPTFDVHSRFYWITYAATWIIPGAALVDALRAKDRPLITAALALSLVTLATNKPYLGVPRQTWDPMLLGVVLIGGVIGLRRWLAAGSGGARAGYTAEAIGSRGREWLEAAANASVAWHGRIQQPPGPSEPATQFEGGRSGGGGAGASF
jgi:hypothetical protein